MCYYLFLSRKKNGPVLPLRHAASFVLLYLDMFRASQVVLLVKNPPANAGDVRDAGSIPRLGRSPGEENGNPFQYTFQEIMKDRKPGVLQSIGLQGVRQHLATEQQ